MTETQTVSGIYVVENQPVYVVEASPGQGIQEAAGGLLPGIDPEILDQVSETMTDAIEGKVNIRWLLTEATQEQINMSQENIQLFIVALERVTQLSIDKMLKEKHGVEYKGPGIVFGHSVGEIAALIRAGVISEAYAAALTYERGRLMGEAGRIAAEGELFGYEDQKLPGSALVVIGYTEEQVLAAIKGDYNEPSAPPLNMLRIASNNGEKSFTISGPEHELEQFKSRVRKTIPVDTNVAVHNEIFMDSVSSDLEIFIDDAAEFSNPKEDMSLVLNGEIVLSGVHANYQIVDGVSETVMFDKGSKAAISHGSARLDERGVVMVLETNPNIKPALIPMMRDTQKAYGRRLVMATFGDVLEYGLNAEAIRASKE